MSDSGTNLRTRAWPLRLLRELASDRRGAVLVMVAVMLVGVLGAAGLAVDLGRGYIVKSRLSRAVDAGVLAAARSLRLGQGVARQQALAMARANGVNNTVNLDISFGTNSQGENTVSMSASRPLPTSLMRLVGIDNMDIGSRATAAVPPVDLVLVLDQSGSLGQMGAWRDLQTAAKEFVGNFNDGIDQLGLVSFQIVAANRFTLAHDFTGPIDVAINAMRSQGYTNTGEGLRLAYQQMQGSNVRAHAAKVVVFFTDGRPTAFRGLIGSGAPADGGSALGPFTVPSDATYQDRIMTVPTTRAGGRIVGYYNNPNHISVNGLPRPDGCSGAATCFGWTQSTSRSKDRINGVDVANAIRSRDVYIYTIGLGNPAASDPLLTPDMGYLSLLANENGIANSSQPKGRSYFAPSKAQLGQIFQQVAQDLLVRLTQ
jgi:Flp pilus assembly protein TadG